MRKNYISGNWVTTAEAIEVHHPYDDEVYDAVPSATESDAAKALDAAERGAKQAVQMGAFKRYEALLKAANLLEERQEQFAMAITEENGKPITEARVEAMRCVDIIRLSAFEGTQIHGDQMPYGAAVNGAGKMGFTMRVPCGIVVAITPFNFPLMLALHKLGPALATGNAVILKPASVTPISSVMITELLHEAGFEGDILQLVTGPGSTLGAALVADPRPRKVSFTGSADVGLQLAGMAGLKKLSLELGSNCPMVVLPDADMKEVAKHVSMGGYANAGQVCISLQRAIVVDSVYDEFLDEAAKTVGGIKVGPPKEKDTQMASMIEEKEAIRVEEQVKQATGAGARVVVGGERNGSVVSPTLVADAKPDMEIVQGEVFGPVVAAMPAKNIDEAIAMANDTEYGLSTSIFTSDVTNAMRFARDAEAGSIHINWSTQWRADFMPYGGLKKSGIGKEGMRATCHEMTEEKTVIFHGVPPVS